MSEAARDGRPAGVTLAGRPAAPGVAVAAAHPLAARAGAPAEPAAAGDPDHERARLEAALERAESDLEALADDVAERVGPGEGEIFEAQASFAGDPEVATAAREAVGQGASAEEAIRRAFAHYRELLAASASEYLSARVADLDDVTDRVLAILQGASASGAVPDHDVVIVAHDLTPSQTAELPHDRIAALVTETGSPTSHAAILARALAIPAVVAVDGLLAAVADGAIVGVDGASGEVVVDPDDAYRRELGRRAADEAARRERLAQLRDEPGRTADGHAVELAANIADAARLAVAAEAGAAGSGLVRTELLFQERTEAPSAAEQQRYYADVLATFPGQRVVFRTMDVGADKPLPFVVRDPEPNPALGVRGVRLSLARPDLLREQLAALLGARDQVGHQGRLAIMFPMVATAAELDAVRAVLDEVAAERGGTLEGVEVGAMVEVPSAALAARRLARRADFLSIGTNDLLQYLFAADRLVGDVADLPQLLDPDVLGLLAEVVEAVHAEGAWVGVCGEAAADPTSALALVGLGVDELSMTPAAIPEIKAALRAVELSTLREAVAAARGADDPAGARESLARLLG